jgi:hypothetical protein
MERGEIDASPSKGHEAWNIPRAIKFGTFQWPLNKDVSLLTTKFGTFHWPPNWGFSLSPSIFFLLKAQTLIIWMSIFGRDL